MNYDEDLNQNNFFVQLKTNFFYLIEKATEQKWIICVPKNCVTIQNLTENDFWDHILTTQNQKNEKNSNKIYLTLNGQEVKVKNGSLVLTNSEKVFEDSEKMVQNSQKIVKSSDNLFKDSEKVLCNEEMVKNNKIFFENSKKVLGSEEVCKTNEKVFNPNKNQSISIQILFEETFYTEDLKSYKIWCINNFLNQKVVQSIPNPNLTIIVNSLNDAKNFLLQNFHEKNNIFIKIDTKIQNFMTRNSIFDKMSLKNLKIVVRNLFDECFDVMSSAVILNLPENDTEKKILKTSNFYKNLNISFETYLQNLIYKFVFDIILTNFWREDSNLNKTVKNLNELQVKDLEICSEITESIPNAKQKLAKINNYSTFLDKINCLKMTFLELNNSKMVTSDELLSIFVFLILKSNIPNWVSNLVYLKEFRLQNSNLAPNDETDFLVATLEASIEFIKSGIFKNSTGNNIFRTGNFVFRSESDGFETGNDSIRTGSECFKAKNNSFRDGSDVFKTESNGFTAGDDDFKTGNDVLKAGNNVFREGSDVFRIESDEFRTKMNVRSRKNDFTTRIDVFSTGNDDSSGNNKKQLVTENNTHIKKIWNRSNDSITKSNAFTDDVMTGKNKNYIAISGDITIGNDYIFTVNDQIVTGIDHTVIGSDHIVTKNYRTTTGSDYFVTGSDHIVSKSDHIVTGSDHFVTGSDHFVTGNDRFVTRSDYFVAESDHNVTGINNMVTSSATLPTKIRTESYPYPQTGSNLLFDCISTGNDVKLVSLLKKIDINNTKIPKIELCHPLCSCDSCERKLTENSNMSNIYVTNDKGMTILHWACQYGRLKTIEIILKYGGKNLINKNDFRGYSPLHYVSLRGYQDVFLLLLDYGANLNNLDNERNTPLHFASLNGHIEVVKTILFQNVKTDVNAANFVGDISLHHSSRWGYLEICQILIENGGNPYLKNDLGKTPLDLALNSKIHNILIKKSQIESDFEILDNLKAWQLSKNDVKTCQMSQKRQKKAELILKAVIYDDIPLICFYLGLPLPDASKTLCHPLCTCQNCQKSFDTSPNKFDINLSDSDGYTALHMASLHGQYDIVKLLLSNGADVNLTTNKCQTPLHLACQTDRLEIVKLLIEYGVGIDLKDFKGNTALHLACIARNLDIVEILIKKGSDLEVRNFNGDTPIDVSEGKVLEFLIIFLENH